jgi:DNA-binding transcriptional regulator YhcF (GntR family)
MYSETSFKLSKLACLQINEQVKCALTAGMPRPGDQPRPIRVWAERLRVNRTAAAKAHGELENEGVTQMERGEGRFSPESERCISESMKIRCFSIL